MTNPIKIKVSGGGYDSDLIVIDNAPLELVAQVLNILAPHVPTPEPEVPETAEERLTRELEAARADASYQKGLADQRQEQLDAATAKIDATDTEPQF